MPIKGSCKNVLWASLISHGQYTSQYVTLQKVTLSSSSFAHACSPACSFSPGSDAVAASTMFTRPNRRRTGGHATVKPNYKTALVIYSAFQLGLLTFVVVLQMIFKGCSATYSCWGAVMQLSLAALSYLTETS